jgi:hypothetical protein
MIGRLGDLWRTGDEAVVVADGGEEGVLGLDGDAIGVKVLYEVEGDGVGRHLRAVSYLRVEREVCFIHFLLLVLSAAVFHLRKIGFFKVL